MKTKSSEIHAYVYIKNQLALLGWNIANPSRNELGEVYTQNECLQNEQIKKYLSKDRPENVIIVRENTYLVIEAKNAHNELNKAIIEAKGYADKMNVKKVLCPFCTAVAGNDEDTYLIRSYYFHKGSWVEIQINDKEVSGLLSKDIARKILDQDYPHIKDFIIPDELYFTKAVKINGILHDGGINKNQRARVMSALLLAMLNDNPINRQNDAFSLITDINSRAEVVLHAKGKRQFKDYVAIAVPPTPDNHIKFRRALLDTIQELESINIRSAMNSGTDVLGRFYEQFLKYGNGAKEIGIVLTPRHITKFGADAIDVNHKDKVFDPACGTGGFLVAAFDKVKRVSDEDTINAFKMSIYGIEQDPEVVALALVNMIFRGDGRTNIDEGNCFTTTKFKSVTFSKVLMNPPFALKKHNEKEYKFIDFALGKMEKNGYLFAIIPSPIMFREKNFREWRLSMLSKHTLKAVIKMPDDLFYPVGVHTSAVIIQAHTPHNKKHNVLWGWLTDGFTKSKGVMKKTDRVHPNIDRMLDVVKSHLADVRFHSTPKQFKLSPIQWDKFIECSPEYYLDELPLQRDTILDGMTDVLNNLFSFKINAK